MGRNGSEFGYLSIIGEFFVDVAEAGRDFNAVGDGEGETVALVWLVVWILSDDDHCCDDLGNGLIESWY